MILLEQTEDWHADKRYMSEESMAQLYSSTNSAEPALPASTTFSDRVCMRFAAACRYAYSIPSKRIACTRDHLRAARNTRSTVDKNHDKRNNDVVFTERKSDLELHHFTQLGTFTHEKRRDPHEIRRHALYSGRLHNTFHTYAHIWRQ